MDFAELVTGLVILLSVATGVALLAQQLRIPYVVGLVLAGLAISELLPQEIGLSDSLILNIFLPILVFEASVNTDVSRLRSTVKPIALLAGPGVVLAAGITAAILKWGLGFSWIAALLAGVILAITDTVSVIAVFKEIAVPSRLTTIVEGESLFNDGIALVLFSLILKVHEAGSITLVDGVQELLLVIVGGTLIGIGLGYLSTGLFIRSDEPLSSILLTVAIALGAFQIGHFLHVSGVVAVVVAGLIVGNIGISRNVSASTRLTLLTFWESASFGVNSFIFLLIGIEVKLGTLWQTLPAVLLAIVAYQMGRFVAVYPLLALVRRFDRPIPLHWQHILFLGNIKGSLSMALALSLPATIVERSQLIPLIFGTVLVSLVSQATSLPWLVKKLNLSRLSDSRQQVEEWQAQLMTSKAAQEELDSLLKTGILSKAIYEEMRASYQVRIAAAEKSLREFYNRRSPELDPTGGRQNQLDSIRRRLLLAEKGSLTDALRKRILSEDIVRERIGKLDEQLLRLEDD
jgi:CPA1 family monovalent cation:H+ antiporter